MKVTPDFYFDKKFFVSRNSGNIHLDQMYANYPQSYPPFYPQENNQPLLIWFSNTHIVAGQ
jgi:hypothetical protein